MKERAIDFCPFCSAKGTTGFSRHAKTFPDAYPVADGHTLVVPTKHLASIFDLPPDAQRELWELVGQVRARLANEKNAAAFTVGVNDGEAAGQTVEHAHIHVIPRYPGDVTDPRGGIRWVIPNRARYWESP